MISAPRKEIEYEQGRGRREIEERAISTDTPVHDPVRVADPIRIDHLEFRPLRVLREIHVGGRVLRARPSDRKSPRDASL
jgi:hypothetical protein